MNHRIIVAVALFLAVFALYARTGTFPFVSLDDPIYVTGNPHVQSGLTAENAAWAFRSLEWSNWHPLTWLSHMADVELFGMDAGWHHRVNVLLHSVNALLLFFLFQRMTGSVWRSGFVAALFAVHPLHVESVAWVSERKDLLSTLFLLLSLVSYVRYAERPGGARYLAVVLFFALGLMSKPMIVTLPFLMLLLDLWPLRRYPGTPGCESPRRYPQMPVRRLLLEKTPLFLLSAVSCWITVVAQRKYAVWTELAALAFPHRLSNALVAYFRYLGKTVWPSGLAAFYPHPGGTLPLWQVAGAASLLLAATVWLVVVWRRRPYLPVGWFWFLGTLVPVIGLLQVGEQAMADRYTYLPLIGLFVIASWGVPDLLSGRRWGTRACGALGGISLLALLPVTWIQIGFWKDSVSLYTHTLEVTKDNWIAENSLGTVYLEDGDIDRAISHFRECIRIRPESSLGYNSMGLALIRAGRAGEAAAYLEDAVRRMTWDDWIVHYNLGVAYEADHRYEGALKEFEYALRLDPGQASAHFRRGKMLQRFGRRTEAIQSYREALRLDPNSEETRRFLETVIPDGGIGIPPREPARAN